MAGEIDMPSYVTMNMVAVAVKAVGITMKRKQLRHGIGEGLTVTRNEAAEKIVAECKSHKRCCDCMLFDDMSPHDYYACWLAVIAGDAPENWEDKDEK